MTDEAMAAVLQRLRWSYFGDRDPRYLDPDNTTATDSTTAEARFIEWALLEYRSVPGASTLMHAWLTNHLALPHNESADVCELWEAAAAMYRLEPWTVVKAAMLMSVHIDDDPDPRVAVWSGDAGNRRSGLMVYDNAYHARATFASSWPPSPGRPRPDSGALGPFSAVAKLGQFLTGPAPWILPNGRVDRHATGCRARSCARQRPTYRRRGFIP
jgi:hypothetical protein